MQRILKIIITSHKDYSDEEIFSHDVATALRKLIYMNNVKRNKTTEEAEGTLITKNKTTISWKHSYKIKY